jgi:hypothetical protein
MKTAFLLLLITMSVPTVGLAYDARNQALNSVTEAQVVEATEALLKSSRVIVNEYRAKGLTENVRKNVPILLAKISTNIDDSEDVSFGFVMKERNSYLGFTSMGQFSKSEIDSEMDNCLKGGYGFIKGTIEVLKKSDMQTEDSYVELDPVKNIQFYIIKEYALNRYLSQCTELHEKNSWITCGPNDKVEASQAAQKMATYTKLIAKLRIARSKLDPIAASL